MRIRILKDGTDSGHSYKKGEIYEAEFDSVLKRCIRIIPQGSIVTYCYSTEYGIECEILSENKIYELW